MTHIFNSLISILFISCILLTTSLHASTTVVKNTDPSYVENFLTTGKVILIEDTELGITQPKRLTIQKNNVTMQAVFKSFSTKKRSGRKQSERKTVNKSDRFEHELAAYQLNKILDINMIPLTTKRKVNGKVGMVQLWVVNSILHRTIYKNKSNELDVCPFKEQNDIMNMFDILIYNEDRNLGNRLYTLNDCRLWMIDHSRAFRIKSKKPKSHRNVKVRLSEKLAQKLIGLNEIILEEKLGRTISKLQIDYILKRRDLLIKLWQQNGKLSFRKG